MMYLRFLWQQLKVVGMVIISFLIFLPILYPKRKKIWDMRLLPENERKWYWYNSDTYETGFGNDYNNYLNSTYGIYELIKKRDANGMWVADYDRFHALPEWKKKWYSFVWLVTRNGSWNYIVSVLPAPFPGIEDSICKINKPLYGPPCQAWRSKDVFGEQNIVWPKDDPKWFRYSITKKASWYNLHRLFGSLFSWRWLTHFNFMIGHSSNRHLVKMRSFTLDERSFKREKYLVKGNKHLEDIRLEPQY